MKMFYLQGSLENVWLTIPLVLSQIFLPFKVGQASFALKLPVFLLSPSGRVAFGVPHAGLGVQRPARGAAPGRAYRRALRLPRWCPAALPEFMRPGRGAEAMFG